jgi:hypothetical protein
MSPPPQLPDWLHKQVEEDWITTLVALNGEREIREFLDLTLTPLERFYIGCRFRAIVLLCHGIRPGLVRQLSVENPKISRGVITRANSFVRGTMQPVCMKFYERLKQARQS